MLNTRLISDRLAKGVGGGGARDRTSTGPTPTTLTIMKGRSMGRTKSLMRKVTMVIFTAVLAGRTGAPHLPSGLVSQDTIQ